MSIIIYGIIARLMLVPFNEEDEDIVVTTSDPFDTTSTKDDIKKKRSQLLPFMLHMSKYFNSRNNVTSDVDFKKIDQRAT